MKLRKIAAISLLLLSSLAAEGAAPSDAELEAMYDKAFREFGANNYEQALKDLDAVDARQPDLAESQNLRGVILMRQKDYANAEKALQGALAADPKFWNARFNLAEIPFLEKDWAEARKRFQELLNGNSSELQGEAIQLIQYKILITYLMEGKENMVQALMAKFELSPDTPAVHYANAAIALHKKDETGAKEALTIAEKSFSAQLNKLFAESLYEVGWLEKPAGETRAALELNSAAEQAAKTKAFAKKRADEAEQALQQRDLTAARKLVEEASAVDPQQASIVNLRGEILLEQKEFDQAENEFNRALKLDSQFRDAEYNLAQIPFKKKEYAKARDRFEALFSTTSGADKDNAAQLIKYKVYLTYLLEDKDARARTLMNQFQFTGDTPALYYAQAAWEFKHGNPTKANDWIASARKIYSPVLNGVFLDVFYDLGWIPSERADSSAPAAPDPNEGQPEQAPSIEPTPLPATASAEDTTANPPEVSLAVPQANHGVNEAEPAAPIISESLAESNPVGAPTSPTVETPVATTPSFAAVAEPPKADAPEEASSSSEGLATSAAATSSSPMSMLAPVRDETQPTLSGLYQRLSDQPPLLLGGVLLAGILLLGWIVIPEIHRRIVKAPVNDGLAPASDSSFDDVEYAGQSAGNLVVPTHLAAGPPQVSLQLHASEPAVRRVVKPLDRNGHSSTNGNGAASRSLTATKESSVETEPFVSPAPDAFQESAGEPSRSDDEEIASSREAFVKERAYDDSHSEKFLEEPEVASGPAAAQNAEAPEGPAREETVRVALQTEGALETNAQALEDAKPFLASSEATHRQDASERTFVSPATVATFPFGEQTSNEPTKAMRAENVAMTDIAQIHKPGSEISAEPRATAADTGAALAGIAVLRQFIQTPTSAPEVGSSEETPRTTPAPMPETTQTMPAPVNRTSFNDPVTGGTSQPAGGMEPAAASHVQPQPGSVQTAVELTFSFEIASLQLTPAFKMGALLLKPNSKIVTMRLAGPQHSQPGMNLQVTFEIATVQLQEKAIETIRLTPSQEQRRDITSSPSLDIAGLQVVPGADLAPVQLTPSQQGRPSVHMRAPFEIATVEFSPSFEIASIVLNSSSKNVSVQLPGNGASAAEGASIFEMTSVQLAGNGEIEMVQLSLAGAGGKQSA